MGDVYDAATLAPWLVLLSQHMPLPRVEPDGRVDGVVCSCGSGLYLGHLAPLLAEVAERTRVRPPVPTERTDDGAQR